MGGHGVLVLAAEPDPSSVVTPRMSTQAGNAEVVPCSSNGYQSNRKMRWADLCIEPVDEPTSPLPWYVRSLPPLRHPPPLSTIPAPRQLPAEIIWPDLRIEPGDEPTSPPWAGMSIEPGDEH